LSIPANAATLTAGTGGSRFNYVDDTNAQIISTFTSGGYYHLYLNNTSPGGVILGSSITATNVTGSLRVQSGVFKSTVSITGGAGDTFEVSDGAVFEMFGSTTFPSGFSSYTLGPTSRVRYLQTRNPINVAVQTYGHLDLMPSGTATQNFLAGSITVQGDLSIGDGTNSTTVSANANSTALTVAGNVNLNTAATLVANSANPLNVAGDWTNNGTFTHNNSSVAFTGSALSHASKTYFSVAARTVSKTGDDFVCVRTVTLSPGDTRNDATVTRCPFTVKRPCATNCRA
jgi:hypothetical protein